MMSAAGEDTGLTNALNTTRTGAPASVRTSHLLWLAAIATAITELVTRLAVAPEGFVAAAAGSPTELAVRFAAYALLLGLSLAMLSGRGWARWALLIIFGGLGTFSLVFEPIGWLLEGGSVSAFLAGADGPTWIMTLSRVAHIACVWAGVVFMFLPSAGVYFRR